MSQETGCDLSRVQFQSVARGLQRKAPYDTRRSLPIVTRAFHSLEISKGRSHCWTIEY